MRPITTVTVLALGLALAAGCGGKVPPSHYYRLAPPGSGAGAPEPPRTPEGLARLEVGISPFHVDPPYDQDRIVYRVGREGLEVGFYSTHRWAAPLSRLLPALLSEQLMEVAGGFVSVGPPAGRPLDARLEGHVKALEEIDTAGGSIAYFKVTLTLRDRAGEALWTETLEAEAPLQGTEVGDAVKAMQAAVMDVMARARAALTGALLGLARATSN